MRTALQKYIHDCEPDSWSVVVDNIAMAEQLGGSKKIEGQVVMSLVNLQEETTLKNSPYYRVDNNNDRAIYQNPPVNLNLFILFSILVNEYDTALKLLSRVIECFQLNTEVSFTTTPFATTPSSGNHITYDVRLVPDLYSLTFEQLNHLWGALGGKQVPFVLYRVRLIAIEAHRRQAEVPVITEVHVNENE